MHKINSYITSIILSAGVSVSWIDQIDGVIRMIASVVALIVGLTSLEKWYREKYKAKSKPKKEDDSQ